MYNVCFVVVSFNTDVLSFMVAKISNADRAANALPHACSVIRVLINTLELALLERKRSRIYL